MHPDYPPPPRFRYSPVDPSQPAPDVRFVRGFRRLRAANHLGGPRTRRAARPVARNSLTRHVSRGVRRYVASLASPLPHTISNEGRRSTNHANHLDRAAPVRLVRWITSRSHAHVHRGRHGTRVWAACGWSVDLRLQRRRDQQSSRDRGIPRRSPDRQRRTSNADEARDPDERTAVNRVEPDCTRRLDSAGNRRAVPECRGRRGDLGRSVRARQYAVRDTGRDAGIDLLGHRR